MFGRALRLRASCLEADHWRASIAGQGRVPLRAGLSARRWERVPASFRSTLSSSAGMGTFLSSPEAPSEDRATIRSSKRSLAPQTPNARRSDHAARARTRPQCSPKAGTARVGRGRRVAARFTVFRRSPACPARQHRNVGRSAKDRIAISRASGSSSNSSQPACSFEISPETRLRSLWSLVVTPTVRSCRRTLPALSYCFHLGNLPTITQP